MTFSEKYTVLALLREARRIIAENHDVVDGDGKQLPNWAMRATNEIDEAIERVEAQQL